MRAFFQPERKTFTAARERDVCIASKSVLQQEGVAHIQQALPEKNIFHLLFCGEKVY